VNLLPGCSFAALRTPANPWDTRTPLCVGDVLGERVFSLFSGLPSPFSAGDLPSWFEGFIGTMPRCDSFPTCLRALRPRPSPAGPGRLGRRGGLPVLVQKVSRRAWGLRLRRTVRELALPLPSMLPSAQSDSVGILIAVFRSSIPSPPLPLLYASRHASRHTAQNSGLSGSLLLSRKDLSSSASCRFIPALSRHCPVCMRSEASPFDWEGLHSASSAAKQSLRNFVVAHT
jgi:hypothetical protein